jgi:hypothetical protein
VIFYAERDKPPDFVMERSIGWSLAIESVLVKLRAKTFDNHSCKNKDVNYEL